MKKIVIDARISGESTGRYVDKLIQYLAKINPDHEIVVLTRKHRVKFIKEIAPNFEVIESNYPDFSFGEQLGFARQLYSLKADLVHFPMVQQPLLYVKPKVTSMLDLTTVRFTNPTKNQLIFKTKQKVYWVVNWFAAKTSRQIITISNYVRDEVVLVFRVNKSKITTTYNAADYIPDKPEPIEKLKKTPFIMYVGRPQPHKNLHRLVDALGILIEKEPKLKLVFVGKQDGLSKELEKYAHEKGLGKSVVFTGFASEGQLKWLYQNTKCYVFPSLSEGFGLPSLEAMVHGAPVASSNATCLPEINGKGALYFDPLNVNDIAKTVQKIIDNSTIREKLVKKGAAKAAEYSWERMAQQTFDVYEKALRLR